VNQGGIVRKSNYRGRLPNIINYPKIKISNDEVLMIDNGDDTQIIDNVYSRVIRNELVLDNDLNKDKSLLSNVICEVLYKGKNGELLCIGYLPFFYRIRCG
jgi:hypothetical protein